MRERRAGLENSNAGADPAQRWGRPPLKSRGFLTEKGEARSDKALQSRRGSGDGMLARKPAQTREILKGVAVPATTRTPRGAGLAPGEVGEVRSSEETG